MLVSVLSRVSLITLGHLVDVEEAKSSGHIRKQVTVLPIHTTTQSEAR